MPIRKTLRETAGRIVKGLHDRIFRLPPHFRRGAVLATEFEVKTPQWNVTHYDLPQYWERGITGEGIVIGIADTGIDPVHESSGELAGQILDKRDFTGEGIADGHGHGTHVSSIACGVRDGKGMCGVAPGAKLLHAKVLDSAGRGSLAAVVNGIRWLIESGAQIISLSLGTPSNVSQIKEIIDYAARKGILVFAAAGNDGRNNNVDYPAAYANCFGVGAHDPQWQLASFSDRGAEVDFLSPGVNVMGGITHGDYESWDGTSMACPHGAAMMALRQSLELKMFGRRVTTTMAAANALLDQVCRDAGPAGRDPGFGRGFMDPAKLLTIDPTQPPPAPAERTVKLVIRAAAGPITVQLVDESSAAKVDPTDGTDVLCEPPVATAALHRPPLTAADARKRGTPIPHTPLPGQYDLPFED